MLRKLSSRLYAVVLCSLLTGCLPYPHTITTFPRITGKLIQGEQPQKDVVVFYTDHSKKDPCTEGVQAGVTDSQGIFKIKPARESRVFKGVAHTLRVWSLCFKTKGGEQLRWLGSSYGPESAPERLRIVCDRNYLKETYESYFEPTVLRGQRLCRYQKQSAYTTNSGF